MTLRAPSEDARMFAHWAAQLATAPGTSLADPSEDFRHTTLTWSDPERAFLGVTLPSGTRAGLDVNGASLFLLDSDARRSTWALPGKTIDEGLSWLKAELGAEVQRPQHDMPAAPMGDGAPFPEAPEDLDAVEAWFAFAAHPLSLIAEDSRASELVLWPHHFDLATLIHISGTGKDARSVGVGLAPGDGSYDEPYFYVSPWPYPKALSLPALSRGHWHTDGFTAAVLTATEVGAEHVELATDEFLHAAVEASIAAIDDRA